MDWQELTDQEDEALATSTQAWTANPLLEDLKAARRPSPPSSGRAPGEPRVFQGFLGAR